MHYYLGMITFKSIMMLVLLVPTFTGDRVALPPEHRDHFSEKLLLMNPCYIANDYAQVQGSVLSFNSQKVYFPHCFALMHLLLFKFTGLNSFNW